MERDAERYQQARVIFQDVEYLRDDRAAYALPLACAAGEQVDRLLELAPQEAVARLQNDDDESYRFLDVGDACLTASALLDCTEKRVPLLA